MKYKALALGVVLGFIAALVPSCGSKSCGPASCSGCCDASNNCVMTQTAAACGTVGRACIDCTKKPTTPTCDTTAGICTSGNTGGGAGTGGGSGGGGGGGGGGGTGGGGGGGGGVICHGCCSGSTGSVGGCLHGTCVTGDQPNNCGANTNNLADGIACTNCALTSQTCTNNVCTGGNMNDGGVTGKIGSACTMDSDCIHEVGTTPGVATGHTGYYCKMQELQPNGTGAMYPGGYCTHRCTQDSDCGNQGFCSWIYALGGQTGEGENFCIADCTTNTTPQGTCRTGYICVSFPDNNKFGCLLANPDGGMTFEIDYDAGPIAHPGTQGNGCTMDTDCQPPDLGACIPDQFDGGPSGWPGGMCEADCTFNLDLCGTGAICAPQGADLGDGLGLFVDWQCEAQCSGLDDGGMGLADGGTPPFSCRPGYHCDQVFTDGTGGCVADCDNPGNPGCNTAGGFSCINHRCQ